MRSSGVWVGLRVHLRPLNGEARYSPCGRTGVGEVDIVTRTLTLPIDGALYETTEMEFISPPGETLADHSNYLMVRLDDGSRIEIGSVPGAASWQEYVASTRDVLLQIVSSYQSLADVTPDPCPRSGAPASGTRSCTSPPRRRGTPSAPPRSRARGVRTRRASGAGCSTM